MMGWLTVLGAILKIVLLTIESHHADVAEVKQSKADQAKGISDAIASGDVARINSVINKLRS